VQLHKEIKMNIEAELKRLMEERLNRELTTKEKTECKKEAKIVYDNAVKNMAVFSVDKLYKTMKSNVTKKGLK